MGLMTIGNKLTKRRNNDAKLKNQLTFQLIDIKSFKNN